MFPCEYDLPLSGLDFTQYYSQHNVYHPGIDFNKGSGNQDCGNPIAIARAGKIEYVHKDVATGRGFGIFLIIKHNDGNYTRYAHMKDCVFEIKSIGEIVKEGQLAGQVGKTGTASCHCHFEVFNEKLATIQRGWKYPWRFYPSGKTKQWVIEHYLNPWEWLKTPTERGDLDKGYEYLQNVGAVVSSKPKDAVTVEMLGLILKRLNDR